MLMTAVGLVALARIWQVFRFDFGRSFERTLVVRVCWVWGCWAVRLGSPLALFRSGKAGRPAEPRSC